MTKGMSLRGAGICLVLASHTLSAQDCHQALRGRIMEAGNHAPLAYASIHVKEVNRGALSDEQGYYAIPDLCEGTAYTVEVSHLECAHLVQVVRLTENHETNFQLVHDAVLHEVLVQEKSVAPPPVQAQSEVAALDLEAGKGLNLSETLKRLPGVSSLNTGATIAKPVIQGLHSNRIAIVSDNVVLEGQQWGSEHAPEIDPFTAGQIRVIKGAAALRYGTGAIGGAVVLDPPPLREKAGLGGWLSLGAYSNGRGGVLAGALDGYAAPQGLSYRIQGTAKRSGNLRAPDYWLGNTGVAEYNVAASVARKWQRWMHQVDFSRFQQQLGVMRSAHVGNLTDLQLAIESVQPLNNKNQFSYRIDRPYQMVEHSTLKYENNWRISEKWKFSSQYALQYNYRREFDVIRSSNNNAQNKPQVSFQLWTHQVQAALEHFPIHHWQGGIGVQGVQQTNWVGRGGYIPDFNTWAGAIWAMERWRRFPHPLEFEAGLRYDVRRNDVRYSEGTFLPPGVSRDTSVGFGNFSATAGGIYHFSKQLKASVNSAWAWRPPHVYELFARGIHFVSATYEAGNRYLQAEKAWNNQIGLQWESARAAASLTLYHNQIQDFIYLSPTDETVLTVRGAFPKYEYRQNDAVLQGIDWSGSWEILPQWSLESRASLLRARLAHEDDRSNDWLPLMPADRYQYGVKWAQAAVKNPDKSRVQDAFVRLLAATTLRQTRVPLEGLLKVPPGAYTLLSLDAGCRVRWGRRQLDLGLSIQNLGNLRYREYLNFFRFFADEPGLNAGIRAKIIF